MNDISDFQMLGDFGKKLFSTAAGQKLLGGQLVKQADVVLLLNIFPTCIQKRLEVLILIIIKQLQPTTHHYQQQHI